MQRSSAPPGWAASGVVVAAALSAAWAGPQGLTRGALRKRFLPALSGQGATDGVALTFDDGPDPRSTPAILNALDQLGWRATFFLLGSMVQAAPALAAEIVAAGHEVAVHGYQHRSHLWRSAAWVRDDLRRALDVIGVALAGTHPPAGAATDGAAACAPGGARLTWYRPPHGSVTLANLRAARWAGLRFVLWTSWGRDWRRGATSAEVLAEICRTLRPGGTILLHDSDCTSAAGSWRATLATLPHLAAELDRRGLAVRPLRDHSVDRRGLAVRPPRDDAVDCRGLAVRPPRDVAVGVAPVV